MKTFIKPIDIEKKNDFLKRVHTIFWTLAILWNIFSALCVFRLYQEKKDILNVLFTVRAADVEIQK